MTASGFPLGTAILTVVLATVLTCSSTGPAHAQEAATAAATPQPLTEAWWTGPMLAASPNTLPRGHSYFEPYLFDVRRPNTHSYGSLTYLLFGVTDRFTLGLQPTFGYNSLSGAPSSSGVGAGDTTVIAQYELTRFRLENRIPSTAIVFEESFPTGRYDNLGNRPSDGLGSGAFTTSIGLYSQDYFWLPNRRIFRARLDVLQSFSPRVPVSGVSVFGTGAAFHGYAYPGSSFYVDASGEYSATRSWVPALDITYRYTANTSVASDRGATTNSGVTAEYAFAPAIEYSWTSSWGVLLGTRFILRGHNVMPSTTPAIAISFFN
jgi:hypothetical protein